jgi:hypothetical protein
MTFDGIGRHSKDFFTRLADKTRDGEKAARGGIRDTSPGSKFTPNKGEIFIKAATNRENAESMAGKIHAHYVAPNFKKETLSANSARGQKVLADLWEKSDSRLLGLSINSAPEQASKVTLATNTQDGHNAFANMFKAREDYTLGV